MSKKINVLFLVHLPPPVHGAAIACNYIKSSELINEEIEGVYINLALNTRLSESGKASIKKIKPVFVLVKSLLFILFRKHFDLCHFSISSNGLGFYKDFILVIILKIFRIKIVYHFHNKGVASGSKKSINKVLYRIAFRNTKSILLSPSLFEDIKMFVKPSNVYYCPYGIPIVKRKIILCNNSNVSRSCNLLFLSNMMLEKGVYVLLEALQILKKQNLKFVCHFVGGWGDIIEKDFNRELMERELSDVVFAHGPKYQEDKYKFFEKADIFIFPTFYHFEAFPLVTLEAMQFGLPIITTNEGGLKDIVLDNTTGLLVPQKDSIKLAEKIELLINQKEFREKLGEEGKIRFFQNFTIHKFEGSIVNILKDAAQG